MVGFDGVVWVVGFDGVNYLPPEVQPPPEETGERNSGCSGCCC